MRSYRGTQFRQWAMARLSDYLVKGFTMDDKRVKNPPGKETAGTEEAAVLTETQAYERMSLNKSIAKAHASGFKLTVRRYWAAGPPTLGGGCFQNMQRSGCSSIRLASTPPRNSGW